MIHQHTKNIVYFLNSLTTESDNMKITFLYQHALSLTTQKLFLTCSNMTGYCTIVNMIIQLIVHHDWFVNENICV